MRVYRKLSTRVSQGCLVLGMLAAAPALAQNVGEADGSGSDAADNSDGNVIVVTARLRSESLLDVPVAVTAMTGEDLARYGTADLAAIGNQTPGMIIHKGSSGGGGQITLRGISTANGQAGFEQAVSVNIDGVQSSRGRAAINSFFDLQQVEVLKGPQALYFGKNSPAGVISLVSRGPSDEFEGYGQVGYEFKAGELIGEGAVSIPLAQDLGVRVAVRVRNMDGWMTNNSVAEPTPFNTPGAVDDRPGESEFASRITVAYTPDSPFNMTLKVLGNTYRDDGMSNMVIQVVNCGSSPAPETTVGGVVFLDPTGDCKRDSNLSNGGVAPEVAANWPIASRLGGQAYSKYDSIVGSLTMNLDYDKILITSVSGILASRSVTFDNYDATTYALLAAAEREVYRSISQQLRVQTNFDGPINFMAGAYYEDSHQNFFNSSRIAPVPADPVTGKYQSWEKPGTTDGRTISVFGQASLDIMPNLELSAGGRYTHEKKDSVLENTYIHPFLAGVFNTNRFVNNFRDSNFSPEVSLTYHPMPNTTLYAAYKTGFKSGGLGLSAVLVQSTTLDQINFDSEKVKGFEVGAKGQFGGLRAELSVYRYKFTDLQVNSYDPSVNAFTIQNAGGLKQFGADLQLQYDVSSQFSLRGSVVYNRNRFEDYFAQCYSGQTAAQGCTPVGQDVEGRAPARSPDWTGSAGFTYEVPVGDWTVGLTGDAFYSGSYDSVETLAPGVRQDDFMRYDASLRLQSPDERWELALIGRNLSDKRYLIASSDKPGTSTGQQYGTVSRPREIMIQAKLVF